MKKRFKVFSIVVVALLLVGLAVMGIVSAQEEYDYVQLEGAGFAGRTNMRFTYDSGSKVATSENVHYMAVYVLNQADDDDSLIMSGNWSANTTAPNGALVMLWESRYGPWEDEDAYDAQNMSACSVGPDYFFITWGLLGNNSTGWFGIPTKPYMTLDGLGLGVDWDAENVTALGTISMRGRLYLTRDGEISRFKTSTLLQLMEVDSAPHWNAYKSSSSLAYLEDGAVCWDCLLRGAEWICDFLYGHFGIDICPDELEGEE